MGDHARLAPSAAHRWIPCPGSIRLTQDLPDTAGEAAREGTAAHHVAEYCLREKTDAEGYVGTKITVSGGPDIEVDMAMADAVNDYIASVELYAEGNDICVEEKVDFSNSIAVKGQYGTADVIVSKPPNLTVIDLKYGRGVRVDAENNPQLMLYAAGALEMFGLFDHFETLTLVIIQPRLKHVSEWTLTIHQLEKFVADAASAAGKALRADDRNPYLNPGDIQCRFCPAKASCPALADDVMRKLTGDHIDFSGDNSVPKQLSAKILPTETITLEMLSDCMRAIPLIENWCRSIRARTERELLDGKTVDGFKLVQGRRGPRKWSDKETVEELMKSFRLRKDEMYSYKLISPTEAEKRLSDNQRRWQKLQTYITQSQGPISVAQESDDRPAIEVTKAEDSFENLL